MLRPSSSGPMANEEMQDLIKTVDAETPTPSAHQRPLRRSVFERPAMLVWFPSASDAMLDTAGLHLLFWVGMCRTGRHENLRKASHLQQSGTSDMLNHECDASQHCIYHSSDLEGRACIQAPQQTQEIKCVPEASLF
ncbi:hypothetical protein AC579_8786 [Pseudocercospora musae]|uniref:Uncharacterized protein n=1 Tax=Pseudocercospora musae TaxID=113226 RepID=A0A139IWA7_9PEZI|nr:hypothetical protein AC579_8786 [Pseudocercospora musae]